MLVSDLDARIARICRIPHVRRTYKKSPNKARKARNAASWGRSQQRCPAIPSPHLLNQPRKEPNR
jgi:hypothetical protein